MVIVKKKVNSPPEAVRSGSALFAYAILPETSVYEILVHLP